MTETDLEGILVNLKILASLEIGQKLITTDKYLDIEKSTFYAPESVRRTYRGDSRDSAISRIDTIMTRALEIKDNDTLIEEIKKSKKGIQNLKDTYKDCVQTKARLDTILDKINKVITD
mgnify:CR=1 FL=1|jgi:hypothetical protein